MDEKFHIDLSVKKYNIMKQISLLLFIMMTFGLTAQNKEKVYAYNVGDLSISTLPESQGNGNTRILVGTTPEMLEKYLPGGTFPNAVNAFFVKMPDKRILIDAGFGRQLFDHLKGLDVTPEQIDVILLTHMHGDHIGGLLRDGKKAFPRAEFYLSKVEHDYWANGDHAAQMAVINAYRDKLHLFDAQEPNDAPADLIPGVQGLAAYGHTPGHTVFMFRSGDEQLLVWGDLTHAMKIQMPCPDVAVTYDVDPTQAIASRKKILEYVSGNNIPVAGMHIAYPGIGKVKPDGENGYIWEAGR
jgi:glyoxylase-like metal-dependent hydrolase (beta-lactamase superfamily II)